MLGEERAADGAPVLTIVVVGSVCVAAIDVRVVAIGGIVRCSRPPVPVATLIAWGRIVIIDVPRVNNSHGGLTSRKK